MFIGFSNIYDATADANTFTNGITAVTTSKTVKHNETGNKLNANGLPRMERMYQLVLASYSNVEACAIIRAEYNSNTPVSSLAWVKQSLKPTSSKHAYALSVLAKIQ